MCLRYQFCTHQRVYILHFYKKSQIRCTLLHSLFFRTKVQDEYQKNFTEKSTNYQEHLNSCRADTKLKWNVGNRNVFCRTKILCKRAAEIWTAVCNVIKSRSYVMRWLPISQKILKILRWLVCRVCTNMCTRICKKLLISHFTKRSIATLKKTCTVHCPTMQPILDEKEELTLMHTGSYYNTKGFSSLFVLQKFYRSTKNVIIRRKVVLHCKN